MPELDPRPESVTDGWRGRDVEAWHADQSERDRAEVPITAPSSAWLPSHAPTLMVAYQPPAPFAVVSGSRAGKTLLSEADLKAENGAQHGDDLRHDLITPLTAPRTPLSAMPGTCILENGCPRPSVTEPRDARASAEFHPQGRAATRAGELRHDRRTMRAMISPSHQEDDRSPDGCPLRQPHAAASNRRRSMRTTIGLRPTANAAHVQQQQTSRDDIDRTPRRRRRWP
jgi:hypothetical protein